MNALIVKDPWCSLILDGIKTIELRGNRTKIRGKIGIIKSGTGMIWGTVNLVDCIDIDSDSSFVESMNRHCYKEGRSLIRYKKVYGWVLENPVMFKEPIVYKHKMGCVIWVKI